MILKQHHPIVVKKVLQTSLVIQTYTIWAEALSTSGATGTGAGGCLNLNNMIGTLDDTSGTTSRQLMSAAVLQGAPSLSNHNGAIGNDTSVDLGQRGHSLNASGYGSWPYILSFEFDSDNLVEYGSDSVNVEYGNTGDYTSINIQNNSPSDMTHIYLSNNRSRTKHRPNNCR